MVKPERATGACIKEYHHKVVATYHSGDEEAYNGQIHTCPVSYLLLISVSQDLTTNAKNTDTRRSARTKATSIDLSREPYMLWTNRKAINAS